MPSWVLRSFRQAAWAPLLVWLVSLAAALSFNAFNRYPWLDAPAHFFGGMAMTYFFAVGIDHAQRKTHRISWQQQLLLAVVLAMIVALGWEGGEYLSDRLLGTSTNHGVADTLGDLGFGLCGSIVIALARIRVHR